jgi:hypothetical protein
MTKKNVLRFTFTLRKKKNPEYPILANKGTFNLIRRPPASFASGLKRIT